MNDSTILTARLINALYTEAMLLTDEARSYFEGVGRDARDGLEPLQRVGFACEALTLTTRLMHVVSWLLAHRALTSEDVSSQSAPISLGSAPAINNVTVQSLPDEARHLIVSSEELYNRIARMDRQMREPLPNPARQMLDDLARAF